MVVYKIIQEISKKYPRIYNATSHNCFSTVDSKLFAKVFDNKNNIRKFPSNKLFSVDGMYNKANVKSMFMFSQYYADDVCVSFDMRNHNIFLIPFTKHFIDKIESGNTNDKANFYYAEW